MIQTGSLATICFQNDPQPCGCFPKRAQHLKNKGPGTVDHRKLPGSGLLTEKEIARRRGETPRGRILTPSPSLDPGSEGIRASSERKD